MVLELVDKKNSKYMVIVLRTYNLDIISENFVNTAGNRRHNFLNVLRYIIFSRWQIDKKMIKSLLSQFR